MAARRPGAQFGARRRFLKPTAQFMRFGAPRIGPADRTDDTMPWQQAGWGDIGSVSSLENSWSMGSRAAKWEREASPKAAIRCNVVSKQVAQMLPPSALSRIHGCLHRSLRDDGGTLAKNCNTLQYAATLLVERVDRPRDGAPTTGISGKTSCRQPSEP